MKFLKPILITLTCIIAISVTSYTLQYFSEKPSPHNTSVPETTPDTAFTNNKPVQKSDALKTSDTAPVNKNIVIAPLDTSIREFIHVRARAENHFFCHVSMQCPETDAVHVRPEG